MPFRPMPIARDQLFNNDNHYRNMIFSLISDRNFDQAHRTQVFTRQAVATLPAAQWPPA